MLDQACIGGAVSASPVVQSWRLLMTKDVEDAAGDLTADFAALRRDVARVTETIGELVQRQTQSAGLRASEAVGEARDRITNTAAEAQGQLRSASGEIEASIERNPLTAVLIAFGVGISLGVFGRSRG
jgi:ElaB/YqjD/DUF883 family membrane-anchored ribosome-binding protein